MSATIRNLLIKWGADLSGAQKGFKQLSKDLKSVGKSLSSAGSTLTKSVTAPVAATVGALTALTVKSAGAADDINTLAQKFGLTTDRVQELQYASQFLDVEFDKMAGSMQKLTHNMDLARYGSKLQEEAFAKLGVQYKNTDGTLRNAKDVWNDTIDALNNISNEAERDAIAYNLFGRSAVELNPLIKAGSAELEKLSEEAHSVGAVINKDSISSLNKLNDTLDQVKSILAAAGGEIAASFAPVLQSLKPIVERYVVPALKGIAQFLADAFKWFSNLSPQMQQFMLLLGGLALAIGPLLTVAGKFVTVLSNVTKGLGLAASALSAGKGLLGAITAFLGPAGTAVAVISAIALAVGGLIIAFSGAESETDKLRKKYEELNKEIEESRKQFETQVAETETNAGAAQKLADELYTLADKEKKTNAEKKRMVSLVEQLNSVYPDLNLEINEQTGLLNKQHKTVKDIISAKKQEITYNIYAEKYTEILKKEIELEEGLESAKNNLTATQKRYNEALSAAQGTGSTSYARYELGLVSKSLVEAQAVTDDFTNALNANKAEQDALAAKMETTANNIYSFGEAVTTTNEEITISNEEMAAQQEELQKRIEASTQAHYDSMGGIYDKGIEQNKTKLDQVNKNLRTQVEQFESWRSNIKKVAELVPKDVYGQLVKLGPESAPLIAELVSPKNKDKLNEFVALMQTKSKAAKDAALEDEGLGGLVNEVSGVMDDMKGEIEKTDEIKTAAYNLGKSITSGLEKGMDSGTSVLYSRARAIARQVINVMRSEIKPGSPSKVTTLFGQSISDGLTAGMAKNAMAAFKQSRKIASGIVDSFKTISMPNYTINATGKSTTPTTGDMYSAFSRALKENAKSGGLYIENFYNNTDDDIRELAYKLERCRQQASAAIGG
jgi:hypothetical protein